MFCHYNQINLKDIKNEILIKMLFEKPLLYDQFINNGDIRKQLKQCKIKRQKIEN